MVTYTTEELQKILHCGRGAIDNYRKAGELPAVRIGKNYIYQESDIQQFLDKKEESQVG